MFWLWDGQPEYKPEWFKVAVQWMACKIWGHEPIADCSIPEHDFCCWCMAPTPGQFNRVSSDEIP